MVLYRIRTGKSEYRDNNSDQWVVILYTPKGAYIQLSYDPADATIFDSYNLAFDMVTQHRELLKEFSRIEIA